MAAVRTMFCGESDSGELEAFPQLLQPRQETVGAIKVVRSGKTLDRV